MADFVDDRAAEEPEEEQPEEQPEGEGAEGEGEDDGLPSGEEPEASEGSDDDDSEDSSEEGEDEVRRRSHRWTPPACLRVEVTFAPPRRRLAAGWLAPAAL